MKKLMVLVAMMVIALTAAVPTAFAQGTAASQQYAVEERVVNFEFAVEDAQPADATFFAAGPLTGLPVRLADPDGDGTYTGTTTVKVTVNPDGTTQPAPIAIFGGVGTNPVGTGPGSKFPGYPSLVVEDFGSTVIRDGQMFRASISFEGDREGAMTPGNGDEVEAGGAKSSDGASVTKALPETGGVGFPITVGVASALLVGGLLIRRLVF